MVVNDRCANNKYSPQPRIYSFISQRLSVDVEGDALLCQIMECYNKKETQLLLCCLKKLSFLFMFLQVLARHAKQNLMLVWWIGSRLLFALYGKPIIIQKMWKFAKKAVSLNLYKEALACLANNTKYLTIFLGLHLLSCFVYKFV